MVRVVFVLRRSAIIFAPSTFRLFPPKLQTRVKRMRQGVLTLLGWSSGTYFSLTMVWLLASISAMNFAPSALILPDDASL